MNYVRLIMKKERCCRWLSKQIWVLILEEDRCAFTTFCNIQRTFSACKLIFARFTTQNMKKIIVTYCNANYSTQWNNWCLLHVFCSSLKCFLSIFLIYLAYILHILTCHINIRCLIKNHEQSRAKMWLHVLFDNVINMCNGVIMFLEVSLRVGQAFNLMLASFGLQRLSFVVSFIIRHLFWTWIMHRVWLVYESIR